MLNAPSVDNLRRPDRLALIHSDDDARSAGLHAFVASSPDTSLYHKPSFVAFEREHRHGGGLIGLVEDGHVVAGVPLLPYGRSFYWSGYAGLILPDSSSESVLERSMNAVADFLRSNPSLGYDCIQTAQARAADDGRRIAVLESLIAQQALPKRDLYTRVITLQGAGPSRPTVGTLDPADMENDALKSYDGKVRNQIRQGIRHGLRASYTMIDADTPADVIRDVYNRYLPIHSASWARTGLVAHEPSYWQSLSDAVRKSGGLDLVVFAVNGNGVAIAAVTCHIFGTSALYWSGCSTPEASALRANPFCLHAAITLSEALGVHRFELGRFEPGEASDKERTVNAYKASFRGTLIRLTNFRVEPSTAAYQIRSRGVSFVRRMSNLKLRRPANPATE